jgi:hypothetical protein
MERRGDRWAFSSWVQAAGGIVAWALVVVLSGCPQPPGGDGDDGDGNGDNGAGSRTFSADTTLAGLRIAAGVTDFVENDAEITVTGDVTIDGTLRARDGRLTLRVEGNLVVTGSLEATGAAPSEESIDEPLADQSVGIFLIVGSGSVTFGPNASVSSAGPVVITDKDTLLSSTPGELYEEVESGSTDNLPTLVPLPPDSPAFAEEQSRAKLAEPLVRQDAGEAPVTISGVWPPGGAPVPGDRPVVIFRFSGNRPLILDDWTVNGPAAPPRDPVDQTENAGTPATGRNGRNGMRLNIRNDGGPIRIVNEVVLNLADGGNGADATTVCANATGGNGGMSGNFRMTGAGGIDISGGSLVINPGRGGNGGTATVQVGVPAADGCPGGNGASATGRGGNGADNRKRLLVRGNVEGVENVTIGPLSAGQGGPATAFSCDAGEGTPCCDGGAGGAATVIGGKGGDASLDVTGLAVVTGVVTGGNGGNADCLAGNGGNGGDCKFDDGGDGGPGGAANATGGNGGSASNTGGGSTGGNGGDAFAFGGDGGDGGNSGLGTPGSGGAGGMATATPGTGGAGSTSGQAGMEDAQDGLAGLDGGEIAVIFFCLNLVDFIESIPGTIPPGVSEGPVTDTDNETVIGSLEVEFVAGDGAQYQSSDFPVPHIGLSNGTLRIRVDSLRLEAGEAGIIGGVRIDPLGAEGLTETSPFVVRALDGMGQVVGAMSFPQLPDNFENPEAPKFVDAAFNVDESVSIVELIAPPNSFVTLIRVYLIDP